MPSPQARPLRINRPEGFADDELLREALEEVAEAAPGAFVEEPWGSVAVAAARQVADAGGPPGLVALALAALERIAEASELRELAEDEPSLLADLDELRERLR
jgi:hypothetical protein